MEETPPAHRTLRVTELLELILLELSVQDIFQAQRVSKQWKAVIESSLPLQQAMWLAPRMPSSPPAQYEEVGIPAHCRLNTVLHSIDSPCCVIATKHFNPNLRLFADGCRIKLMTKGGLCLRMTEENVLVVSNPSDFERFFGAVRSTGENKVTWEDMQLCDPPVTRFGLSIVDPMKSVAYVDGMPKVHNESGIRMGELMKVLLWAQERFAHVLVEQKKPLVFEYATMRQLASRMGVSLK
ncbi:hypothetical protein BU16DRAFT_566508 [Lophium mytilinum]|uniref:F-box domain-containing protein n=1 Tax=Lophium mytilinum TaxID=390894 RepID=A0A6A6QEP7_9PEZI|nr:hypothetical protein BU16DRAFT_566508 [Lophium mytilinum]